MAREPDPKPGAGDTVGSSTLPPSANLEHCPDCGHHLEIHEDTYCLHKDCVLDDYCPSLRKVDREVRCPVGSGEPGSDPTSAGSIPAPSAIEPESYWPEDIFKNFKPSHLPKKLPDYLL